MVQTLKRICWLAALVAGVQHASAFSLLGPPPTSAGTPDGYQQSVIAYFLPGDVGGPKNLGEEYRWNTPELYYTYDQNFYDYFGSNGVVAVDQAVTLMNGLSNVSSYSAQLDELPLEASRFNYRAQALSLIDLKSDALGLMVEEMGLADPQRWTWCLRDRRAQPGLSCPFMDYQVIKRNFDPVTWEPSSYVNGNLFSYRIFEFCTGPDPLADAFEFSVDPLGSVFSAVASFGINYGSFYTDLTRDDVGGLRYMWRTNNLNIEKVSDDSVLAKTNFLSSQLLFTSNLTLLVNQALTNSAAALTALFPNLAISSTTEIFTNVVSTNVSFYFTNFPWSPVGSAATLIFATNRTTNVTTYFSHTFANVVTNTYYPNGFMTILQTNTAGCPLAPPGVLCTTVSQSTVLTNLISGDYYILPANSPCGVWIVNTQYTYVLSFTNASVIATNLAGVTNVNGQFFSQTDITYSTNRAYVIHPVTCESQSEALRQGMERIKFIRRDYDSLLNRFYFPITNSYNLYSVTNNQLFIERFTRVVTRPDFLFSAEERNVPDLAWTGLGFRTIPRYSHPTNAVPNPDAILGSGTVEAPIIIEFNKVGPLFFNSFSPFLLDNGLTEASSALNFIWGSFDGGTNDPVVYPQGMSIADLENQVLMQISPPGPALPNGRLTINYSTAFTGFTATGGTMPYTWSVAPGSPDLPWGLSLNASTGRIAGIPLSVGTYDFVIRMTDFGARYVDRPYSITITP
jgi:hypothetical protein